MDTCGTCRFCTPDSDFGTLFGYCSIRRGFVGLKTIACEAWRPKKGK